MPAADWILREISAAERRRFVSEGRWGDESLGQRLAMRLHEHSEEAFVCHSSVNPWRGTFSEVLDMSSRVASGLAALGVGAGDVVSFQTPNWIEGVATFYGAAMLGAIVAPVVHIYGSRELGYILRECAPRVHVTATRFGRQDYLANIESAGDLPPMEVVVVGAESAGPTPFSRLLDCSPIDCPTLVDPTTVALIGWTSGTTSNPKGVIHSHHTVLAEVDQLGATSPPTVRPSVIANPISHAIGMLGALLIPLDLGRAIHLLDTWDPEVVLDLMVAEDLSTNGGATYFLTSLLDHPGFTAEHLERLPYQGMGGAPVPRAVSERASALGITVYRMYGSTEHPSITGCTYEDSLEERLGTDGRPLPGNEIRVVDTDGVDVATGQPGEILSRGPELFLGYTDTELTKRVFDSEGWYHTGDVGILDTGGYLTITDRISDVIIRGGENISAAEVEEVLLGVPGIAEVAVVAAPDPRMGERAAAVVRMRPGRSMPELPALRDHLQMAGLARQKWPEELIEVQDFLRTASGKVQKYVLRNELRNR